MALKRITKNKAFYEDSFLAAYMRKISAIPVLSKDEEKQLFLEYNNGNKKAKEKLIMSNLRLVSFVASRYYCKNINLQDLIQEGNLALIKAIENFEIDTDFKFSTYATIAIQRSIERYIKDQDRTIRTPVYLWPYIKEYNIIVANAEGKKITKKQIAEMMGVDLEVIDNILRAKSNILSIENSLFNDNDELTIGDTLSYDERSVEDMALDTISNQEIIEAMSLLTENEKEVIIYRYGLNNGIFLSQEELAKKLKVSHQRVCQIEFRAIEKLKDVFLKRENIEYYDDYVNNYYFRKNR